ncbi:MAG: L-2-hydroxyglutarate oxidase [Candidatus Omnitrophica bacterium]|nr:L-2-hydroxyglutarate oxidase [Candidatus Omnitrophota bacterium]
MNPSYDYIIIGAGIIGLSMARTLKQKYPLVKILIIEKEDDTAFHASGRNSGVLHAGFYYTANSLKAKFTVDGNRQMKAYCREKHLPINECGKLVVAHNEEELATLHELHRRGHNNGSNVSLINIKQAEELEPNVRTYKEALYSPDTASVDPQKVCQALKGDLLSIGVEFSFGTKYLKHHHQTVVTTQGEFDAKKVINCAGLYADKLAHDFGFGQKYTMIPFKGLYLKYTKNKTDVRMNIYPVPNLRNPFLGVHFTKTVGGDIKIGPTAIPAFWRENYQCWENFNISEVTSIAYHEAKLFLTNAFHFRNLAFEEMQKYNKDHFIELATKMVKGIDRKGFTEFTRPGIRAQLLDKTNLSLVQDFIVEGDEKSLHLLNAVSPAFTCAFPFSKYIVDKYL